MNEAMETHIARLLNVIKKERETTKDVDTLLTLVLNAYTQGGLDDKAELVRQVMTRNSNSFVELSEATQDLLSDIANLEKAYVAYMEMVVERLGDIGDKL